MRLPALISGQKLDQRGAIIAFREPLAAHQPFGLQHSIWQQKTVGGHQIHLRARRPAAQQGLQQTRRSRLADRHRTSDTDDKGRLGLIGAQKVLGSIVQPPWQTQRNS